MQTLTSSGYTQEVLTKICEHLNELLKMGVVPGYCMEIVRGHASSTHTLEIYNTGDFKFQVRLVEKK